MSLKSRIRLFGAVIVFLGLAIQFQNCAVGGDAGALQLGSSKNNGPDLDPTPDPSPTPSPGVTCTCPDAMTVTCGQAYNNSCGVVCGTGKNGCTPNCADVNPGCMTGAKQYRYNGGGGGCGSGTNCDVNGNLANSDCTDCPCRDCN
jgi:hypothetical protein